MNGLNDNLMDDKAASTIRRATAPTHILEAVDIVRTFLGRVRNAPKDQQEKIEWIK